MVVCGFPPTDKKTGIPFNVKLLDIPVQIIEKYKGLAKGENVFPMLGPGRINYALKIIAKLCNITTKLSFHVGRHVFASELCLSQGVPIESVSRMMGPRIFRLPNATHVSIMRR